MLVHHAGNPIEAEAVKLELLHPVTEIAEEETENFVVPIVEQPAIPKVMTTLASFVEIEVVRAIEFVEAVKHILACVRVHNIKEDRDSISMGCVDQLPQVFWRAIPRARGKEAGDLVPECWNVTVSANSCRRN